MEEETEATKWTPGPWHVSDSNEVLDEQSLLVAAEIMGERAEIYQANAHLIAAAPELHAALTELLCWLGPGSAESRGAKCSTLGDALQQARGALAKARGEA